MVVSRGVELWKVRLAKDLNIIVRVCDVMPGKIKNEWSYIRRLFIPYIVHIVSFDKMLHFNRDVSFSSPSLSLITDRICIT